VPVSLCVRNGVKSLSVEPVFMVRQVPITFNKSYVASHSPLLPKGRWVIPVGHLSASKVHEAMASKDMKVLRPSLGSSSTRCYTQQDFDQVDVKMYRFHLYHLFSIMWAILPSPCAADAFYYGPLCTGDYFAFTPQKYWICNRLPDGYARSYSAYSAGILELDVVFRPSSTSDATCGKEVCSVLPFSGTHCCTSAHKDIKGVIVYPCIHACQGSRVALGDGRTVVAAEHSLENVTCVDAGTGETEDGDGDGETGLFVQLHDRSYHRVGHERLTAEELQSRLEAKGSRQLSEDRVAELLENGLVD